MTANENVDTQLYIRVGMVDGRRFCHTDSINHGEQASYFCTGIIEIKNVFK